MKIRFAVPALLLLAVTPSSAAPPTVTPEQFLRGLYAKYVPHGKPVAFVYPDAKNIVDPAMLKLLKHDRDMSKGEVGAMDGDPICNCQDWGTLKVTTLKVTMSGDSAASADVTFKDLGDVQNMRFSLVVVDGDWRIHDISTKDTPSLAAYLRDYKY
ncbi:MAG TPA: DUF3828 domain-containing protein [Rhizomicrobium sp.]|nr:DUF3828 domain-containing protein [Rhizomicrobium sp.]